KLKIDSIKLDGSYVRNISENPDNQFFLQSVTDIAHGLDIKVIAEHIENENDLKTIKSLGIDAVQGYFIEQPHQFPN
ncbi:MAG: EAL domain-containing protein, partial [Mariprofundaceae bacterium]